MKPEKEVEFYYDKASNIALEIIEKKARKIMRTHKNLTEFVMGMGMAFFNTKNDCAISPYDSDAPVYMKSLGDFIIDWDEYLKLTGGPMRFTAIGPINREW